MLISTALVGSIVVAFVGAFIFWANPARRVNRLVLWGALQTAVWLVCWHLTSRGLYWVRWTNAMGGLVPLSLWLVKEAIVAESEQTKRMWKARTAAWVLISLVLVFLPFTNFFIPSFSTKQVRLFGLGYFTYFAILLALYFSLLLSAMRPRQVLSGAKRVELQIWLGGGSAMFLSVWILIMMGTATRNPIFRQLAPLVVLFFYAGIAGAITMKRVFDARQILLLGLEKVLLVAAVSGAAFGIYQLFVTLLPQTIAFVTTTAATLWIAVMLNQWLDRFFQFYPKATEARQAAFAIARRELRIEALENAFLDVLKGWGQAEHAFILSGGHGTLSGGGIQIPDDCATGKAMRHLRWATPERLARERLTPERSEVAKFLAEHKLGALVIGEGPTMTALIGVGVPASRRPFTYPQVTQLIELASIIEGALERAHFSVKAQHAEQLATVGLLGASLAHEIRNPLVTIKTFVQLLPRHHQDETFRQKFFGLIGEEVTRIDRLTEQLLDLASPRAYHAETIELHPVLNSSIELVAAKATDKRIKFLTDFRAAPDQAFTDASAARQVLLNLCFNAIQAVETIEGERWVRVSTRNVGGGIEMRVEDSGPGIAEDIRPRLFQPFQSNKSSGFGLGLAICSDILSSLDATISVDPASPGQGASFRVVFPAAATAPATGNAAKPPGRGERVRAINAYP